MKKALLPTLFSLFSLFCHAQVVDEYTAQTIAWFDLGESRTYEYTTDKYRIDGMDTLQRQTMIRDIVMTVVDSTEVSYTIELKFSNYRTGHEIADKFQNALMKDVRVLYMTDEVGAFTKLLNLEEMTGQLANSLSSIGDVFEVEVPDKMLESLSSVYRNNVIVMGMMQKFVRQFHFPHGGSYTLDDTIRREYEAPIMEGFDLIVSRETTVWLSEISIHEGKYTISVFDRIKPESVTELVSSLAATIDKRVAQEIDEMFNEGFENETNMTMTMDNDGWVDYSIQETIVAYENSGVVNKSIIMAK